MSSGAAAFSWLFAILRLRLRTAANREIKCGRSRVVEGKSNS